MTSFVAARPIVSLIVVNYNGADCVRSCVESLLAESEPAREVLVVDNASTDARICSASAPSCK